MKKMNTYAWAIKNIKYDFNYIKKNLDLTLLMEVLNGDTDNQNLIDDLIWNIAYLTFDEWHEHCVDILNHFHKKEKKTNFRFKLDTHAYNGTLFPHISKNFKLETLYAYGIDSHSLVSSKIDKKYYHFFCFGNYNNRLIKNPYSVHLYGVEKVFSKKPNKKEFLKHIWGRFKDFQNYEPEKIV